MGGSAAALSWQAYAIIEASYSGVGGKGVAGSAVQRGLEWVADQGVPVVKSQLASHNTPSLAKNLRAALTGGWGYIAFEHESGQVGILGSIQQRNESWHRLIGNVKWYATRPCMDCRVACVSRLTVTHCRAFWYRGEDASNLNNARVLKRSIRRPREAGYTRE